MSQMKAFGIVFAAVALLSAAPAIAQPTATPTVPGTLQTGTGCLYGQTTCYVPGTPLSPLQVFDTTFSTVGSPGTLSATTTTSNLALPANGSEVEIANGGSVPVYVNLGVGSGITATVATSMQIPKGQTAFLPVGNATYIAGITASSTASVTVTVGILAPVGQGGSSVVTGNQSNAGVGTTGGNNVPTNSYTYYWNGSGWIQWGGAVTVGVGGYAAGWDADCTATPTTYSLCYWASQIYTGVTGAIPAQSSHGVLIGAVEGPSATGSAEPSNPVSVGAESSGNVAPLVQPDTSIIWPSITTGTTTQLIAGASGKKTWIQAVHFYASAADTVTFEYSAASACGSGVSIVGGPYVFGAAGGMVALDFVIPAGDYFCVVTNTSATLGGGGKYTQQ
jgi:hypothetical protein